jgi:S-methylmethionine-dependent homocysteine/selenocysteine methylase
METFMATYRHQLPQLTGGIFLTDGGIETTLIYDDGFDLPDFAAFPLLDDAAGHAALQRYFDAYLDVAVRHRVGIVLETPTWRASPDWAARQSYTAERLMEVNQAAVDLLVAARHRWEQPDTPVVISGCIGPRGDGYQPDELMTVEEACAYHSLQARAFATSEADLITAITMNHPAEAIGVALAARDAAMPVVISFTVETDGTLPSGNRLGDAITGVDEAAGGYPAYYMINCAHPIHFAPTLDREAPWTARIGGIRANASTMSHAELDAATELDGGDPADLAERYRELRNRHPHLRVLGGCCGTNHHHIDAIAAACVTGVRS